jgi:hypothetical protein
VQPALEGDLTALDGSTAGLIAVLRSLRAAAQRQDD